MDNKSFKWTAEALQTLRGEYHTLGPAKLAELLGTSLASVMAKAKRVGIKKREISAPAEWTEEMIATLKRIYATAGRETLVEELRLPLYTIRHKARELGLKNIAGKRIGGRKVSLKNTSCNIHYFDNWSEPMAYILGFIFADGSLTRRGYDVIIGLAKKDEIVLDYIKKEVESARSYYRRPPWVDKRGYKHQEAVFLTLSSKIMVERLVVLGLRPHKTYTDEPFPYVPRDMLPHFIRGYFDGDGAAIDLLDGRFAVRFTGSPKFILGIINSLVTHADMPITKLLTEKSKKCVWARAMWSKKEDVRKFYNYVYPPTGFSFCLERKRHPLYDWLSRPQTPVVYIPWTNEQVRILKERYFTDGPKKLAKEMKRTYLSIRSKARELGIISPRKTREDK